MVSLVTPVTVFSPSLTMAFLAFFSLRLCLVLLTCSSFRPAAAATSLVFVCWASPSSSSGISSSLSLSVPEAMAMIKNRNR